MPSRFFTISLKKMDGYNKWGNEEKLILCWHKFVKTSFFWQAGVRVESEKHHFNLS